MAKEDRLISSSVSWDAFFDAICALPTTAQQGAAFERLTQLYLQTQPEYQSLLANVWRLSEVPPDVRDELRLVKVDEGIDLVARTRDGDFWAIQCKFRKDKDHRLTRRELATFTSLAFHTCRRISLAVVAHTCAKPVKKHELLPSTVEIGLERWLALGDDDWQRIRSLTAGESVAPKPREPRPHQRQAVEAAKKHYVEGGATRGRLIMPCGTGKSLTAFWIARALGAHSILVAVPSLALIRQSLTDWTREYLAVGVVPDWLVVCSDESTGKLEQDEFVGSTYDLGIPATTDADEIAAFLQSDSKKIRVVFATYQSGAKLAAGVRRAGTHFDLGILDEAHKTVGVKSKAFAALLYDANVPIGRRIFMTATERVLSGRNDDVVSMDDPDSYGERFYSLSFKQAIAEKLISDYRIVTITVSDERIQQLIEDRRLLNVGQPGLDEADAQALAAGIALKRAYEKYGVRHAISFHRSIRSADQFAEQQETLNEIDGLGPHVTSLHISSKKSAGERADLMRSFAGTERALLTNARCLTEGVDIPAIDCVLFADPKQSTIDIVQAAGRALRRFEGKEYGYIVLPLVVPSGMTFDEFAATTEFRQVAKTITALSIQDERIAEEFRVLDRTPKPSGRLVAIEGDVPVGLKIEAGDFAENIHTKVWERVGKANWRPFEQARAYVRSLRLTSQQEWTSFRRSNRRPVDIPTNPNRAYKGLGWSGMGDWLGTGAIATGDREFRPFIQAREFVRSLGLRSGDAWRDFCGSSRRPTDIPVSPDRTYADNGWMGWGDWLGTGRVANRLREFRPFGEARDYVRALKLSGKADWAKLVGRGVLPNDIPTDPARAYGSPPWAGWGDWLGTGTIAPFLRHYRSFESAREFARSLRLRSVADWLQYSRSPDRPSDIPSNPQNTYRGSGWCGFGDWLGTGAVAPKNRKYRSFADARDFVRSLGLKSKKEWEAYIANGLLPHDIPSNPNSKYRDKGWIGFGDWLGTDYVATFRRKYRPFDEARTFARGLKLGSVVEWRRFAKSEQRPEDIPANPDRVYAGMGWKNFGDWLGTGRVANSDKGFLPFEEARAIARSLGVRSGYEWRKLAKTGRLPTGVPSSPWQVYRGKGWVSEGDWVGSGHVATWQKKYRPFPQARDFARALGLRSRAEWIEVWRAGGLPEDMPAKPDRTYATEGWAGYKDWLGKPESPQIHIDGKTFSTSRQAAEYLSQKYGVSKENAYARIRRKLAGDQLKSDRLLPGAKPLEMQGRSFRSIKEAARILGVSYNTLRTQVREGRVGKSMREQPFEVAGQQFESRKAAADFFGISYTTLLSRLRKGMQIEEALSRPRGVANSRPVLVKGRSFGSMSEAARHFQVPLATVLRRIERGLALDEAFTAVR